MAASVRDIRCASRMLRKSPGFAAGAILSLAFGIGANTAIFTLVDRVLLRSLPVQDPARLVMVFAQRPGDILRLVVGEAMLPVIAGAVLGCAAAFGSTRILTNLLFGVSPTDLTVYAGVSIFAVTVALTACFIPARRATRVDPMVAFRYE